MQKTTYSSSDFFSVGVSPINIFNMRYVELEKIVSKGALSITCNVIDKFGMHILLNEMLYCSIVTNLGNFLRDHCAGLINVYPFLIDRLKNKQKYGNAVKETLADLKHFEFDTEFPRIGTLIVEKIELKNGKQINDVFMNIFNDLVVFDIENLKLLDNLQKIRDLLIFNNGVYTTDFYLNTNNDKINKDFRKNDLAMKSVEIKNSQIPETLKYSKILADNLVTVTKEAILKEKVINVRKEKLDKELFNDLFEL